MTLGEMSEAEIDLLRQVMAGEYDSYVLLVANHNEETGETSMCFTMDGSRFECIGMANVFASGMINGLRQRSESTETDKDEDDDQHV